VAGVDLLVPAPTGLLFAAVSPLVAWLVLRHGVLSDVPVRHGVLFAQMHDGMIVVNERRDIVAVNGAASELLALDVDQSIGQPLADALPDLAGPVDELVRDGAEQEIERDGRHFALRMSAVTNAGLDDFVYLLHCRDITRERAARRQLVRSEELLRSLIQNSSNAILRLRCDGGDEYHITIANPVAAELFDIAEDRLVGRSLSATLIGVRSDELRRSLQAMLPAIRDAGQSGEAAETEFRVRAGNREQWYRMVAYPVGDDIGITCIDITRQREQERELESAAFLDPLTGVLNRRGFERRASACLAEQDDDAAGALLFIDLDEFKRVNDIHGHETGDMVLQMAAERLLGALRDHDIVARLGGDEFVVLAPETSRTAAESLRERLESTLCDPYQIGNKAMNSSASVGMAHFPEQGVTLTSLLRAADAAMYERKTQQRTTASGSFRIVSAPD
jgi:diguanylate cyclase (GGDEF)-like protein